MNNTVNDIGLDTLGHIFEYVEPLFGTQVDQVCKYWRRASQQANVQAAWTNNLMGKIVQKWKERVAETRNIKVDYQWNPNFRIPVQMGSHSELGNNYFKYRLQAIAGIAGLMLSPFGLIVMLAISTSSPITVWGPGILISLGTMGGSAILCYKRGQFVDSTLGKIPITSDIKRINNLAKLGHFRNEQDLKVAYLLASLYDFDRRITLEIGVIYCERSRDIFNVQHRLPPAQ